MKQENIRNFSIIAHIDHGKSTLADRILEVTGAITEREKQDQLLDSMDLERERGITIKLNTVQLKYNYKNQDYILHLIDTPGHVDFTYEVSRSLAACEGAILVVDAAQGIEAQTLANLYLAMENDLTIIPVINKIDLPNADPEKVKKELMDTLGFNEDEIVLTSAKNGIGIKELVETVIEKVPAPTGNKDDKLQALIFDSYFDAYRGIVALVRIVNGKIKVGDKIKMMATNATYDVVELCTHTPKENKVKELVTGEVGMVVASIKNIEDVLKVVLKYKRELEKNISVETDDSKVKQLNNELEKTNKIINSLGGQTGSLGQALISQSDVKNIENLDKSLKKVNKEYESLEKRIA